MSHIHIWEADSVGTAPFKVVGFYSIPPPSLAEANPSLYQYLAKEAPRGFSLGQCAVCGRSINHNALVKDANGRTFSVGMDCVAKAGDAGLMTEAEHAKRESARIAREMNRQLQYEAYQAQLEAQRERNGGLTDDEVEAAKKVEAEQAKCDAIVAILTPILNALKRAPGHFGLSMAAQIEGGDIPHGGALAICCEIYAKAEAAKTGSGPRSTAYKEAFWVAKQEARNLFEKAGEVL